MNFLLLGLLALASASNAHDRFEWPGGARCAVSLTYDDAIPSQLKNAWPALDKAGLRGTFFLCCGAFSSDAGLKNWLPVAKAGHELGSHSVHHACSINKGLALPKGGLEAYDLLQMQKELKESQRLLVSLGVRPAGETYAYPCGDTFVGKHKETFKPVVDKLFKAARGVMSGVADPETVNFSEVPGVDGAKSAEGLRYWVEQAENSGGWVSFMFHGVGGDYLSVKLEDHQALLNYLKDSEGLIWVAPFGEVADWVKKHR